ncbi:adenylate/guanylate cyclase domain-containing protein [Cupriavidus sp. IK-TO18]|uniref:adenylate/guanylate cyclase domain-containing protein n=1 Tax=Cupriavidus sp. IK-TO18 TaxID=2782182 RepID=UPI001898972D|nr:adenylate/guanylate cyclase domain-containing protein [Cupriavidus sp. IK-TO18]MBF6992512.1 AAA family ATPase [Cupriavidus sp. IK-TO18]
MRCASCGFENPVSAERCDECGAKLVRVCHRCGQLASTKALFCSQCGASLCAVSIVTARESSAPAGYTPSHLAQRIREAQAEINARGPGAPERKTITALFADIAGSTALIHNLDPEDAHRLIAPVLALMIEAVHHYEGYVAKSMGDGILALFGAPIANEDHPKQALLAALRMQEAMRQEDALRQVSTLQIRVGIHSGEVLVRAIDTDDLHTDYDPVGNSIHIASRMENIAEPGSIVASESTYSLTDGYFEFKALGAMPIKGLPDPLPVYEVLGLGTMRTRLQVSASRGFTRFVGRNRELETFRDAVARTEAGNGEIISVIGEPGVGKSRLCHEFKMRVPSNFLILEAFSVSYGKAFSYLPLIELLRNYFQITPLDTEAQRRENLTRQISALDPSLEDCLPYIFSLLGSNQPSSALVHMDASIRRQRTFDAIKRLLVRESQVRPVALIVEDLQWLDSETESFLHFLAENIAGTRIMLLVNHRTEHRQEWGRTCDYTELQLAPLHHTEARELLRVLLGDTTGLAQLEHFILTQTEGNPFFIEEVVMTLVEERVLYGDPGHFHLAEFPRTLHIPATVQGVLAARIDRLQLAEKSLLQTLSVIGKELPWSLLTRVIKRPEDALKSFLAALQAGEFIYAQKTFPEMVYRFKHALTQEVAYGSLPSERRRSLHERTARAIEDLYGDQLEEHCSELAHHFCCSGNSKKAVEYLQSAGRQAVQRSANAEAARHLTTALDLLSTFPDSSYRIRQELSVQILLGPALMAAKGPAAPEVKATYSRALTLCRQVGDTTQVFPALVGLRTFFMIRGELLTARELGAQLLKLAQKTENPALLVQAHRAFGVSLLALGELRCASTQLEQALKLYSHGQCESSAWFLEPGVVGLAFVALDQWLLGNPAEAISRSQKMLALAHSLSQPPNLAHALTFASELHLFRGEIEELRNLTDALVVLATEQGFPYWRAFGMILQGWSITQQGCAAEGIDKIQQGLSAYRAIGAGLWQTHFLALLAEAYGEVDDPEAGLHSLAEAHAAVDRTHERLYEAELYRIKGKLILMSAKYAAERGLNAVAAEEDFQRALSIARDQGARSLELRAAMALSRLWNAQGKRADARQLLAEIYDSFNEGFDTADLKEAKALLKDLDY